MSELKILCVEDDYINGFVIQTILRGRYEIDVVPKPQLALEKLREQPYGVVMLDINLGKGEMNGMELMRLMKEIPDRNPVFAAITAYAMPGDERQLLDAGFMYYISKPVDRDHILEILDEIKEKMVK